jgi:hypothetical protein
VTSQKQPFPSGKVSIFQRPVLTVRAIGACCTRERRKVLVSRILLQVRKVARLVTNLVVADSSSLQSTGARRDSAGMKERRAPETPASIFEYRSGLERVSVDTIASGSVVVPLRMQKTICIVSEDILRALCSYQQIWLQLNQ